MHYREVIDAVTFSMPARKVADLGETSRTGVSKEVVIRKSDHARACRFLIDECGVTPIDINSMCPQFIQVVFDNIEDQILFLMSCSYGDLSGSEYFVEKEVNAQNYDEVWISFHNILQQKAYSSLIKIRHVLRMQVRTFTDNQMDEFVNRFYTH
ncbi:MAG: hypothetical protein JHC88_11910 [Niveispirillum sp.]|nr:hypothetical protein [Niveispirillum sp.]